jgi:hypothetical protein
VLGFVRDYNEIVICLLGYCVDMASVVITNGIKAYLAMPCGARALQCNVSCDILDCVNCDYLV